MNRRKGNLQNSTHRGWMSSWEGLYNIQTLYFIFCSLTAKTISLMIWCAKSSLPGLVIPKPVPIEHTSQKKIFFNYRYPVHPSCGAPLQNCQWILAFYIYIFRTHFIICIVHYQIICNFFILAISNSLYMLLLHQCV